jgi:hypothetical protein
MSEKLVKAAFNGDVAAVALLLFVNLLLSAGAGRRPGLDVARDYGSAKLSQF